MQDIPPDDEFDLWETCKALFLGYGMWVMIGLFLYGLVQLLASFEPKTRLKFDEVTVEQRLNALPEVFTYFHQQAEQAFGPLLPPTKYHDFAVTTSRSVFQKFTVEIPAEQLSQQQFESEYIPKFEAQGWARYQADPKYDYRPTDYVLMDKKFNRIHIYLPIHHLEKSTHWQIEFFANYGSYRLSKEEKLNAQPLLSYAE